jgi:DHA1 family multidrug resistance protein-like MFS transporter
MIGGRCRAVDEAQEVGMEPGSGRLERWREAAATPWLRIVAVLWIAQVVAELAFSFALPFIPLYIQELGVEDATLAGVWAGAMSGGFALVMATMGPVWGMIADRHGRRLMIQRALFGACLVIGAMGLAQSPEQLFVLRLLQGSVTGVVAATTTVVSLTVPRQHLTTALGLMHAALFVGTALGPILGGVVSDLFGFRTAFIATGALFLVSGLLVTFFVPEPAREAGDQTQPRQTLAASMRALLGRRELTAVIGLLALIRFASMAPQPILPIFIQQMAVDEERLATLTGLVVAATGVASTVSALVVGYLADRYGRGRILLASLAAAALLSAPHALATSVWQLLLLRTAIGLALGGMVPSIQALFTELTPAGRRGMAFGLLATANAIGNGGGPVIGSIIAAGFGVPALFVAMTPVFALGAWLAARLPQAADKRL